MHGRVAVKIDSHVSELRIYCILNLSNLCKCRHLRKCIDRSNVENDCRPEEKKVGAKKSIVYGTIPTLVDPCHSVCCKLLQ